MPDAAAPLSPDELSDDRSSSRSLDEVGAIAVLGAMVEQRRRAFRVDAPNAQERTLEPRRHPHHDPKCDLFQKIR